MWSQEHRQVSEKPPTRPRRRLLGERNFHVPQKFRMQTSMAANEYWRIDCQTGNPVSDSATPELLQLLTSLYATFRLRSNRWRHCWAFWSMGAARKETLHYSLIYCF